MGELSQNEETNGVGRKPKATIVSLKSGRKVEGDEGGENVVRLVAAKSSVPAVETELKRPLLYSPKLRLPLFACSVQAGFPSPADDYIETLLDLNEHMVSRPSSTFYVRVTGDSMIGAGILSGDILVVDRSLNPKDGSIVIAVVNDELTVKRLWKKNEVCELHSENAHFPPIKFFDDMELVVWGVVSGVTRKL